MKRLYLFGNHKMNLTQVELNEYFAQLRDIAEKTNNIVGVGVSAPYMYLAKHYLDDSKVLYGPQTCHYKEKGAYTGENSIKMLQDFNCNICIIIHTRNFSVPGEFTLLKNNKKPFNVNINWKRNKKISYNLQ